MPDQVQPSAFVRLFTGVETSSTNLRTVVFTLGHFMIDVVVVSLITGAPLALSGLAGLASPLATGVWFWVMDRLWSSKHDRVHHGSEARGQA